MSQTNELDQVALKFVAASSSPITNKQIYTVCDLLINQSCTIPFIARYRKEATGNLDEVQIKKIKDLYEESIALEKRKNYVLNSIKEQDKLTLQLEKAIQNCESLSTLEEIYAPFKSKRKTKADKARELGLQKIADIILQSNQSIEHLSSQIKTEFIDTKKCKDKEEVLAGAGDIIVELFARDIEVRKKLYQDLIKTGHYFCELKKDGEKIEDANKFKDYFDYQVKIKDLILPKNSHRYLAIRRGVNLKILKLSLESNLEYFLNLISSKYYPRSKNLGNNQLLEDIANKAYKTSLYTSLDLEIKSELKKVADEAAINVFGKNLKDLLLGPYLGSKPVLGIDPGIRTGCKVVVISHTGKLLGDQVIYPFPPKNDIEGSKLIIEKIIEHFDIKHIAIGNGTNGRETLQFLKSNVKQVKEKLVKTTLISEAGASIYSASEIARDEFPDKDITVRGAVSIARRFQDPLAELVKIDPKSIGVGQYQHDVNQAKLKTELEATTISCVNYVGVDINTASAPLLSYISGIGPTVAKNIVNFREKNGEYKSRFDFLKIPRFSEKVFEQAAGFLRIYDGQNILDSTFVHPERYQALKEWLNQSNQQVFDQETIEQFKKDEKIKQFLGEHTHNDIVDSLIAPKQDPRQEFESVEFRDDITSIQDLKVNEWYTGVINNLTNFGAFVDLGIKESGLIHISEICHDFIQSPSEKLSLNQQVKARVIEIDTKRKRVALSLKKVESQSRAPKIKSKSKNDRTQKNNAFSGLKNLKL